MSEAQKLMAETVIATLRNERWFIVNGDDGGNELYHKVAHVLSAEIDKALGRLTRERIGVSVRLKTGAPCDCGNEAHPSWCDTWCASLRLSAGPNYRWVSGWTEVPRD